MIPHWFPLPLNKLPNKHSKIDAEKYLCKKPLLRHNASSDKWVGQQTHFQRGVDTVEPSSPKPSLACLHKNNCCPCNNEWTSSMTSQSYPQRIKPDASGTCLTLDPCSGKGQKLFRAAILQNQQAIDALWCVRNLAARLAGLLFWHVSWRIGSHRGGPIWRLYSKTRQRKTENASWSEPADGSRTCSTTGGRLAQLHALKNLQGCVHTHIASIPSWRQCSFLGSPKR